MRPLFAFPALLALFIAISPAQAADPVFKGHAKSTLAVRYLPDGNHIVSGGGDNDIRIWNADTAVETAMLTGHTGAVTGLAVSSDGKLLVSVSADQTLRTWDLGTNKEIQHVDLPGLPVSVALSPDGHYALAGGEGNFDCLVDLKTNAVVKDWPPTAVGHAGVAFSPDGKYFATSGQDKSIYLWDAKTLKQVRTFDGDNLASQCAVFTPDSSQLLTGHEDNMLRLWNVKTGKLVRPINAQKTPIVAIDIGADGKMLASVAHGPNLFVIDIRSGGELQHFSAHGSAKAVSIAPDGRHMVVAESSGGAHVYALKKQTGTPGPAIAGAKPAPEPVGPIDIPVTSAAPPAVPLIPAIITDSDAIERPQYLTAPKPLVKSVTSVTVMAVSTDDSGDEHGFSTDIIATVPAVSRTEGKSGVGFVRPDGDEAMKIGFEEAVRAVTMRYPIWEPGHIDISFGEKYTGHAGPSGSTALALLMLSTLEGFNLDPKCAITGDITVDWKVRQVGGVAAKLHGAALDKCLYAAIPESNETPFADSGLIYGHSAYWNLQVFSISTLQEAMAITRKDRDSKLTQAMELFAGLQPALNRPDMSALKDPATVKTLKQVLQLAPNHLSAKYVLKLADGTAPKTLSSAASAYQISLILEPFLPLLFERQFTDQLVVPSSMAPAVAVGRKRLIAFRPMASPEFSEIVGEIGAFIQKVDEVSNKRATPAALKTQIDSLTTHLAVLSQENDFFEKMVREGY